MNSICTTMQKANNMILINHKTLKESFGFANRSKKKKITKLRHWRSHIILFLFSQWEFSLSVTKMEQVRNEYILEGQFRLRSLVNKSERKGWEGLDMCWGGIYWVKDDEYGGKKKRKSTRMWKKEDIQKWSNLSLQPVHPISLSPIYIFSIVILKKKEWI